MPRKPKAPKIYEEHEIGPQHIGRTLHVKNVGKVHVSGLRPSGEPMYHIIEPEVRDAGSYEDFKGKHGLGKAEVKKDSPGSWDPNVETQFNPASSDPKSFHGQSGVPHNHHSNTTHSHGETIHAPQAAPKAAPLPPQKRGPNVVDMKGWQPNRVSAALDKATTELKNELKDWSSE